MPTGYVFITLKNIKVILTKPKTLGRFQRLHSFEFKQSGVNVYKEFEYVHELQSFVLALTGDKLTFNK